MHSGATSSNFKDCNYVRCVGLTKNVLCAYNKGNNSYSMISTRLELMSLLWTVKDALN